MITKEEAYDILEKYPEFNLELLNRAYKVTLAEQGNKADLCSISNVKSGCCSEDCAYCAQSKFHKTNAANYALLDKNEVLRQAKAMKEAGAERFAMVMSGRGIKEGKELDKVIEILQLLKKETDLKLCASMGITDHAVLKKLKDAGLDRYHHNIEVAESHYANICTTHTFSERIATVKAAQKAGLTVCSGVIWGLGETEKQRIEAAFTLKELGVESVPINILTAVPGTKLEKQEPLKVWEILRMIAIYRMIMIKTNLRLCGGREKHLGDFQGMAVLAGANGLMLGNYLTTEGRLPETDLKMLKGLGFSY